MAQNSGTNNSFIDDYSFDGMRKHLRQDFDKIYLMDLSGNVRKNPKLSGTVHNVFGIQVGVSINFFIKKKPTKRKKPRKGIKGFQDKTGRRNAIIYYARIDEYWRKEQKYDFLNKSVHYENIKWKKIKPDKNDNWLTKGMKEDFETFLPIGIKKSKLSAVQTDKILFDIFSTGISTNRDSVAYDFHLQSLEDRIQQFCKDYNFEVFRFKHEGKPDDVDEFVDYEKIKWSRNLKRHLRNGDVIEYSEKHISKSLYRPFTKRVLYFSDIVVDELGRILNFIPNTTAQKENFIICVSGAGHSKPFQVLATDKVPCLDLLEKTQCFPFYTYKNGRKENITNSALKIFQDTYRDIAISKWDIFFYIYGLFHHPEYSKQYATNLRRSLPKVPLLENFWEISKSGKKLVNIHVNYEHQKEFPVKVIENDKIPLNWRVEKMKIDKDFDKRKIKLKYNEFLTLDEIPIEVLEYKLGNRSAIEWIVDQYRIKVDKKTGLTIDPNDNDQTDFIFSLIKKVITISIDSMEIVKNLPKFKLLK